jgi:ABC-type uncharacterized transport system auxiliary subunit
MIMKTPSPSKFAGPQSVQACLLPLLFFLALVCGGCLSKPALRTQLFAFQTPPPATSSSSTRVLTLRSVTVSPIFDNNSFIYRTGSETYEIDHYASFMASPGQAIGIAVRAHLLASGLFQNVVASGTSSRADVFMEVHVTELYGDFSQPGHPAAMLAMQITLLPATDANNRRPILQKEYSSRIPLEKNTAADVMTGWDTALGEIMTDFLSDVARKARRQ